MHMTISDISIIEVKRVKREDGNFYDRVIYETKEEKGYYYKVVDKKIPIDKRITIHKNIINDRIERVNTEKKILKKKKQIAKTSPKRLRLKGFYQSSIKISIIVTYKNQTPFFFPQRGKSNFIIRAANVSERNMLKAVLQSDYSAFVMWLNRFKKDKNVKIFYGWTYRRVFSQTGSFNGDSRYLDFIERIFKGRRMDSINRFDRFRNRKSTPSLSIIK